MERPSHVETSAPRSDWGKHPLNLHTHRWGETKQINIPVDLSGPPTGFGPRSSISLRLSRVVKKAINNEIVKVRPLLAGPLDDPS